MPPPQALAFRQSIVHFDPPHLTLPPQLEGLKQRTVHSLAVVQSTPPGQPESLLHSTRHAMPAGHLIWGMHRLLPEQSNTQVVPWHVPPCAAQVASHGRPASTGIPAAPELAPPRPPPPAPAPPTPAMPAFPERPPAPPPALAPAAPPPAAPPMPPDPPAAPPPPPPSPVPAEPADPPLPALLPPEPSPPVPAAPPAGPPAVESPPAPSTGSAQ
jgi:hypothetical protein